LYCGLVMAHGCTIYFSVHFSVQLGPHRARVLLMIAKMNVPLQVFEKMISAL